MKKKQDRCLFCSKTGSTRDHIPSKSLLEKPFPQNLFTIQSCIECNHSFSIDEEYFLNVLVEVSNNPNLLKKKMPGGSVFRARNRSIGLRKRIEDSLIQGDDGLIYFQAETDRIKKVIEKNAFGLFYHKYGVFSNLLNFKCIGFYPFSVIETRPTEIFLLTHTERFRPKRWTTIQKNVFSYIVVRDWRRNNKLTMIFHMHNSAWCIIEIPSPQGAKKRTKKICGQIQLEINEI